jgi:hypothetical protein
MLGDFKKYFSEHYQAYHGVADLYVYFIEKSLSLLAPKGRYGMIVSNKWMRANYGGSLRKLLASSLKPASLPRNSTRVTNVKEEIQDVKQRENARLLSPSALSLLQRQRRGRYLQGDD